MGDIWKNVESLSLVTFDCSVWECHVPDGNVNCGPFSGATSRCFEAEAAVVKNPFAFMAEL